MAWMHTCAAGGAVVNIFDAITLRVDRDVSLGVALPVQSADSPPEIGDRECAILTATKRAW